MIRRARHVGWIGLAAVAAGCGEPTKPDPSLSINVVYVDAQERLHTVRAGEAPVATALRDVRPLAPTKGGMAYFTAQGLQIFRLDGRIETYPVPAHRGEPAALSPDAQMLAYASLGARNKVYLHTVLVETGARDSLNVSDRADAVAAEQILGKTPVFSPSGDSVAFLLPNIIGMQLLIYEVQTKRVEVFPVPVPIITFVRTLSGGWPRWMPDQSILFLGRHHVNTALTDTLLVMRVFPRSPQRFADVWHAFAPPDSLSLDRAGDFSFSDDGQTVVFSMTADGVPGVFLARRGGGLRPLVYERGGLPHRPLLIP